MSLIIDCYCFRKGILQEYHGCWVAGGFGAKGLWSHKEDGLAVILHLTSP